MIRKIKILFTITAFLILTGIQAQDPQISQFYSAPMYLAPSYAGSTDGSRVGINFRDQWPSIPGSFITCLATYDHYFASAGSGVGVIFLRDQAGSGRLSSTNISLLYSYSIKINKNWSARPGIQFSYGERAVNYHRMTFGDQVSIDNTSTTSVESFPQQNKVSFIDFAASGLIYSKYMWAGITVDHLAQPNESLLELESRIPITTKVFGGGKIGLNGHVGRFNEESLTLAFLYKAQEKYDQLDLGIYWMRKPLIIGLWYRGIPLFKSYKKGYPNNDALVLLAGFKYRNISFGYSYDFTISKLISSTGGSHEISFQIEFLQNLKSRKKNKKEIVPCPKFLQH